MSANDHGSASTYRNHKCRCTECRAAWAADVRRRREQRGALLAADPTLVPHGKRSTYNNWGCRCADCTEALRVASRSLPSRQPLRP